MWDQVLAKIEFTYNDSPNCSMGCSPFQILYGMYPHGVHELQDLGKQERWSVDGEYFANMMRYLHEQVKNKLQDSRKNINNK